MLPVQVDQKLMERGVYGIAGFLRISRELRILFSAPYFSRLGCTVLSQVSMFELVLLIAPLLRSEGKSSRGQRARIEVA